MHLTLRLTLAAALTACTAPDPGEVGPRMTRMLGCIECLNGEQDAVVQLGTRVVPRLRAVLLADTTVRDLQRSRASLVLGRIGGDSARGVLCEGKLAGLSARVNRFIDSALVVMARTCP